MDIKKRIKVSSEDIHIMMKELNNSIKEITDISNTRPSLRDEINDLKKQVKKLTNQHSMKDDEDDK